MQRTKIEYLTHSWSPIAMRCTPVSIGCANCWHLVMANRLANNPNIPQKHRDAYSGGPLVLDQKELEAPLQLREPARIGVQFMGDLFHQNIPDEFLVQIFNAMRMAPKHKYFLLSKRQSRMSGFCQRLRFDGKGDGKTYLADSADSPGYCLMGGYGCTGMDWVWLGISVENQKTADERIPILLQIPAAKRFVSVEPMLGSVSFGVNLLKIGRMNVGEGEAFGPRGIDWVIAGGESGPGARPLHPGWIRSLRNQCQAAGVPFFFKSWGEWLPVGEKATGEFKPIGKHDALERFHLWEDSNKNVSIKIGHKFSGRLLDGREWNEFPK